MKTKKKTRKDLMELQRIWIEDPSWDISYTAGYEEYREELLNFEEFWSKKFTKIVDELEEENRKEAHSVGLTGLYMRFKNYANKVDKIIEALNEYTNGSFEAKYLPPTKHYIPEYSEVEDEELGLFYDEEKGVYYKQN